MKAPTFIVGSALAAMALAAAAVTIGSKGSGRATAADGRTASFNYEVTKRTEGEKSSFPSWRFRFEQQGKEPAQRVLLEATTPTSLTVNLDTKVCEFTGRAIITRWVDGKPVRSGGVLSVRAQDRRIERKGEPDLLRVAFTPERGDAYGFEGKVTDGDLSVFKR